jgi:hypothetical protein
MEPLHLSSLWPHIRTMAGILLENEMREAFGDDHGFGIGSSDINHCIFGIASHLEDRTPGKVLTALVHRSSDFS